MLTVEELKALPIGDWVWIVELSNDRIIPGSGKYYQLCYREKGLVLEGKNWTVLPDFDGYGTKWVAFKNKEQAEGKSFISPCKVGDIVYWINDGIRGGVVADVEVCSHSQGIAMGRLLVRCGGHYEKFRLEDFNKTWFLSKEDLKAQGGEKC